jgi:uncharacterized protein
MADRMISAMRDERNPYREQQEFQITDDQRILARLYALLHDITHVPFGHTLEDELGIFVSHESDAAGRLTHFLGSQSNIGKIIREHLSLALYSRLFDIVKRGKTEHLDNGDEFIYHLVSDTISADLLDYVLRDSYFCDLDITLSYRFIDYLYLGEISTINRDGQHVRVRRPVVRLWKGRKGQPRRDLLTDLVRLLEARYMIAERVYFHHTKIIAGTMIARAVQEAKISKIITEEDLYAHTDDTLVYCLATQKQSAVARKLAADYRDRRLYKLSHEYRVESFQEREQRDHTERALEYTVRQLRNSEVRHKTESPYPTEAGWRSMNGGTRALACLTWIGRRDVTVVGG